MRNLIRRSNIVFGMRPIVALPGIVLLGALFVWAQKPSTAPAPSTAASGGNGAPADGDQAPFIVPGVTVRAVQAPVTVLDADGSVVNGLNALDFRLYDNGKEQKIFEDVEEHPVSLVVAIQANREMEKILPEIRRTASLYDALISGEDGEIAVIAFDHRIQTLTNFTSDPDQLHAAFSKDKLMPGSSTSALNDATMAGINMLRNRPKNRKRILLVIAENRDYGSGLHVRDVLTNAEFNNVVIYTLNVSQVLAQLTSSQLPNRPDTIPPGGQHLANGQVMTPTLDTQLNQNGNWTPVFKDIFIAAKSLFVPNPLNVYSHYTGAREFPFFTQKGLEQAIDKIGQELHNQYILTYQPNNPGEAGYHTIRVEVNKPGMKIITREGYWPLASKPE